MTEDVVDYDHASDCSEDNLVELNSHWQTTQRQSCVLECLFMLKAEVQIVTAFMTVFIGVDLLVVFANAKIFSSDSDEMYSVLHLHFHLEHFIFNELSFVFTLIADVKSKGLLLMMEAVILICSSLVINEVDLVASDVGLILISKLILILYSDEYY